MSSPTALLNRLLAYFGLSRRVTANIWWLFFERGVLTVFSLTIGIWTARYLTSEPYGSWNYVLAVMGLMIVLSALGMDKIIVRTLTERPDQTRQILGTTFLVRLLGGTLGAGAVVALVFLLNPEDPQLLTLSFVIGPILIFRAFDVVALYMASKVASRNVVLVRTGVQLTCALLRLGLILGKAGVFWFACTSFVEVVLAAIGFTYVVARAGHPIWRWRLNAAVIWPILRDSWPLAVGAAAVGIYVQLDQVMLGKMMGRHEVGIYAAAVKLSAVWYFIPTAISNSLYPSILEAHRESRPLFEHKMTRLFKLLSIMAYAVAIPGSLLAWLFVPLLFGPGYDGTAAVLCIHIWGLLFVAMGVGYVPWAMAFNRVRFVMVASIAAAVINVGLNLVLIPPLGPQGAAIATVASLWTASMGCCLIYPPTRPVARMMIKGMLLRG